MSSMTHRVYIFHSQIEELFIQLLTEDHEREIWVWSPNIGHHTPELYWRPYDPARQVQRIGRHIIGMRCAPPCTLCDQEANPTPRDFEAVKGAAEKQAVYEQKHAEWLEANDVTGRKSWGNEK